MIKKLDKLLIHSLSRVNAHQFSSFEEGDFKKAQQYVIETLRSRSWMDYMISSYYPKSLRTAYCTIQLFNLQLIKISDNIKEPSLGLGRLDFWRGVINKIYSSEKPSAEPISICLHHACHNNPLTKGYFERIINSRAEELSNRNIQSMDQMLSLSQNTYSTITALNLQLLRIDIEKQQEELITKFGRSVGICSYLKRVPYGLRNYRFLVPLDIMSKYNVQPMKIWDRIHGKPSEDFFDAVLQIASYSKKSFEESVQIYKKLKNDNKMNPHAFRAFLKGIETQLYLKDLQKYNFNLFEPGLHRGSPVKFPMSLFKSARNSQFFITGKID